MYVAIYLPTYLFIYISILSKIRNKHNQCIYISIYLSTYLSIYPTTYESTSLPISHVVSAAVRCAGGRSVIKSCTITQRDGWRMIAHLVDDSASLCAVFVTLFHAWIHGTTITDRQMNRRLCE